MAAVVVDVAVVIVAVVVEAVVVEVVGVVGGGAALLFAFAVVCFVASDGGRYGY